MFQSENLNSYLEKSTTIKGRSLVLAEWNMNFADNIEVTGNYRFRPLDPQNSKLKTISNTFDAADSAELYTGATDASVEILGGYLDDLDEDNNLVPQMFLSSKEKEKLLYSLDDCFARFRPRSGINKIRLGVNNGYTNTANKFMSTRPRYYLADKNDKFKYWTSYRTERSIEYGVANKQANGQYYIDDAAPFVVYKDPVPANRIVVKMQTNVGTSNLGPFISDTGVFEDPLYGYSNQTTPVNWRIQYLDGSSWVDAISFNSSSQRYDGTPIIGPDGYVELAYGLVVPDEFRETFVHMGESSDEFSLPRDVRVGDAYLVKSNSSDVGTYYVWAGSYYRSFAPVYDWKLVDYPEDSFRNLTDSLISEDSFVLNGQTGYREFKNVGGLRIVVETMNNLNSTFDLVELSPRLSADISNYVSVFSLQKTASDLGVSGLPVGQLLASTGSMALFDFNDAFNPNNTNSIVAKYLEKNLQIKFYDVIFADDGVDYYVPIKTMYSDGLPATDYSTRMVNIVLRDKFFHFESMTAPEVFIPNVSLSYAVSLLLDSVGFSNYIFKRLDDEIDPVIPFFYIPPDKTVAEILAELAVSTQYAMFFDEYNNLVIMGKEYMLPGDDRPVNFVLRGAKDSDGNLANIVAISQSDMSVYNDGKINFIVNYIQKTYGTIRQAYVLDKAKTWIYKPVLLWEVGAEETTKSINENSATQSGYVLGAMPLNSNLSSALPEVRNGELVNNVIDLGEAIYWISRYNGYFYANGEIIRYDGVEYSVPMQVSGPNLVSNSNVWITSNDEYQEYFSKLPFNGKMYPTGRIRIYAEPNYKIVNGQTKLLDGAVAKHGRGQFGTEVVSHFAGLDPYWLGQQSIGGTVSDPFSKQALDAAEAVDYRNYSISVSDSGSSGTTNINAVKSKATKSYRASTISNFLSSTYSTENETSSQYNPDNLQASALVFNGPILSSDQYAKNHVSFVYKSLSDTESAMTSFGTRMRIIGRIQNDEATAQLAAGSMSYYTVTTNSSSQPASISGGSGGIGVMIEPTYGTGYYFEIAALSDTNIDQYDTENIYNIAFYKSTISGSGTDVSYQTHYLWNGLSNILVDDGRFTGQGRVSGEENTTVYDLNVEYQDFASYRRFFLYLNGTQIATVDDPNPLPKYQNIAMFVRGSSRCMFEHVYAMSNNYSENPTSKIDAPINTVFGTSSLTANEAFRKYSISGLVQSTYLSGISTSGRKYNIYYDEFGTIMREAAYFNIKYDKAYPALYAKISPTFNKLRGYVVSGFKADAYGAEFLVFNATDTQLVLDETSGNYLRIQGITFTQSGSKTLSVDDYYLKNSDLTNTNFVSDNTISSPLVIKEKYRDIKNSRMSYGRNEFTIDATYIQSYDAANDLMGWIISKVSEPRLAIGVSIIPNPSIQLGDIVSINYSSGQIDSLVSSSKRFVVYSISYDKNANETGMTLFLSEVP